MLSHDCTVRWLSNKDSQPHNEWFAYIHEAISFAVKLNKKKNLNITINHIPYAQLIEDVVSNK